jgi:hypothetical protein
MEYINSFLGHYQPTIQTIAAALGFAALVVVILALRKTDRSILIAEKSLQTTQKSLEIAKNSLRIIEKDFERRYRALDVEEIRYRFASFESTHELKIIITFLNTSQQNVVVKYVSLLFNDKKTKELSFELNRVQGSTGNEHLDESAVPSGQKRRLTFYRALSEKDFSNLEDLNGKISSLRFYDSNSNGYAVLVSTPEFKDFTDQYPEYLEI